MLRNINIGLFIFIVFMVGIAIYFDMIRKGKIAAPYSQKKKGEKNEESGYLFLDGSYFMKYPYVDSYPQY